MKKSLKVSEVDFITPAQVSEARSNVIYSDEQIRILNETIPSGEVLEWCLGNDYVVMPAPPVAISLIQVRDLKPEHFCLKSWVWYGRQDFALQDKTSFGWLVIKKKPATDSINLVWPEQLKLLSPRERVPNVAEVSWFVTTYYEVRGVRLLCGGYVRTASRTLVGRTVHAGSFGAGNLFVGQSSDWDHSPSLGLAVARKMVNHRPFKLLI